jgi:uncharacterized protein involved in exopolysaccharide biosynthesis
MTLREILPILRRWWWLIVVLSLATTLILGLRLKPQYVAYVTIQISQPPSEQVLLFEQSSPYSNLRDELTVARNNFMAAARRPEVRTQTVEALALRDASRDYLVDVAEVRDSDFLTLTVEAPTPALAQAIADVHAAAAIQHAARLRAMPAVAAKQLASDRLSAAGAALDAAEHDAGDGDQTSTVVQGRLTQARADYAFWRAKLDEAEVKASNAYAESFMQVVARADLPSQPSTQKVRAQLAMGAIGSLMVGVVLAIVLELLDRRLMLRRRVVRAQPSRVAP